MASVVLFHYTNLAKLYKNYKKLPINLINIYNYYIDFSTLSSMVVW